MTRNAHKQHWRCRVACCSEWPSRHGRTVNTSVAPSRRPGFLHETNRLPGLLGTVTGVLNGAVTVTFLSLPPSVRSLDIFVTKSGDVLRPPSDCRCALPFQARLQANSRYTWT